MKKLLISAVLSSALLISGSLSAKTLKFQISSKAGDWAHTYLNTKNKVLEELTNGELKNVSIPITCRTRSAGGWSGKSLYITTSGFKVK